MSKLPLNIGALEAERTRGTTAFRRRPADPVTDTPDQQRRRRRTLLAATRYLERRYGGDAA